MINTLWWELCLKSITLFKNLTPSIHISCFYIVSNETSGGTVFISILKISLAGLYVNKIDNTMNIKDITGSSIIH